MNHGRRSQPAGTKNVRSLLAIALAGGTLCSLQLALNPVASARPPADRVATSRAPGPVAAPRASTTGGTLWGVTSNAAQPTAIYTIDPTTGVATFVASVANETAFKVGAAVLDQVLYASNIGVTSARETVSVDFVTGDPTVISDQDGADGWAGMAADETLGVLYTVDAGDGMHVLRTLNPDGTVGSIGTGTGISPVGMAFDDAHDILYAVDSTSKSLYTIDVTTGTSQLVGATGLLILSQAGLAYDAKSTTLYLNANRRLYTVDVATGAATEIGSNEVESVVIDGLAWQSGPVDPCTCSCPNDINCDGVIGFAEILRILAAWGPCTSSGPPGLVGLASGNPGILYALDATTGEATLLTELNGRANFTGLAVLDGLLYGSDLFGYPDGSGNIDTGSIDAADGTITFVSNQDFSAEWHGLAGDDAAGVLYSVDLDFGTLYTVAPDGTTTAVAPTSIDARALAYDDARVVLFATHTDDQLYTIDTKTGEATLIGPLGVDQNFRPGLAYDELADTLYLNIAGGPDGDRLYTVDTSTGTATLVGENGVSGIDGLTWNSCSCQEDISGDAIVGFADVLDVLANWGPCN